MSTSLSPEIWWSIETMTEAMKPQTPFHELTHLLLSHSRILATFVFR